LDNPYEEAIDAAGYNIPLFRDEMNKIYLRYHHLLSTVGSDVKKAVVDRIPHRSMKEVCSKRFMDLNRVPKNVQLLWMDYYLTAIAYREADDWLKYDLIRK